MENTMCMCGLVSFIGFWFEKIHRNAEDKSCVDQGMQKL